MKNNKGITLISLVVTIIVLLILAGVSIAMLSGDNSILSRSQSAAEQSALANTKELISVAINEALAEFNAVKYTSDNATVAASASLPNLLAAKLGTAADATTGAIPEAKKINGIEIEAPVSPATTYTVKYKGVAKATFSVSAETGALTWTQPYTSPANNG